MEYKVKRICASEQLKLEPIANSLIKKYLYKCYDPQDILSVCFNMAICFFCVVNDEKKRIFKTPFDVAEKLSLEEIAQISLKAQGKQTSQNSDETEWGINESFGETQKC